MPWDEQSPEVPLSALPLDVGWGPECGLRLRDPTVSRRHARLSLRAGQLVVADLGSRFGTYVNSQRVQERSLQVDDRVRFGHRITYVVRGQALVAERTSAGGLQLQGIGIARQGRLLVKGITVTIEPGQFVGVLGPSGLGKSLLLRTLAGYYPPDQGCVVYAGQDVWRHRDTYWTHVGFIPQTDVLFETLSVRESLEYAARLRLAHVGRRARREAIEDVLELLQLREHAHKLIRVLSGGQRKRVSVAIELIRQPPVLLLDEPATGLDPGNEARLLENLRRVARRGTIVVLSTHSLCGLRLFDRLLVLARNQGVGCAVYWGPPEGLEAHLSGQPHADWYDALERGDFIPQLSATPVAITQPLVPAAPTQGTTRLRERSPNVASVPACSIRHIARQHATQSALHQLLDVASRCRKTIVRDRLLLCMMALQPLGLGLLVVLSQYHPGKVDPILFFSVVVALWLGMNNTVRDVVRERKQYIRDRMAGLKADAYLGAKILVFASIGAVQLAAFLALVHWGCTRTVDESLVHQLHEIGLVPWWLVLAGAYLSGVGAGMLVSILAQTEETAVAVLPLLILPQILLSAVATGDGMEAWSRPRGFRPVVVTLRLQGSINQGPSKPVGNQDFWQRGRVARLTDALSLLCYSRPALLVLLRPQVDGYAPNIWWADLFHLLILLLATYAAVWWLFLQRENHWPALAGV